MPISRTSAAGFAAVLALASTGAHAAPPPAAEQAVVHEVLAQAVRARPAPEVRISYSPEATEALALRRAGLAKTSVDRRLGDEDMTGSLGFLCGLQSGADRGGAAAARGVDPHGRFLGAKLSLSFR
ncbi:hypothetical protein [Phenylobacterium sp.]|uniref:hypothetical protein n=1 Tax=Phenylobacterium sp. TaxID=1871053 RepID=UPI00301E0F22